MTTKKCTKMSNPRAERAEPLFLLTKPIVLHRRRWLRRCRFVSCLRVSNNDVASVVRPSRFCILFGFYHFRQLTRSTSVWRKGSSREIIIIKALLLSLCRALWHGYVVLSGTPEHGTSEHPEHSRTPKKPWTSPKTRNIPPKNQEHLPKYQEERKISKGRSRKYVTVKKLKYITCAWAFLNYIHWLHRK